MTQGLELSQNFVFRKILDEVLFVPVSPKAREQNLMLVLNESAAFFVEALKAGKTKDQILQEALEHFDGVSEAELRQDFDALTEELLAREALRAKATP